MRTLKLLVLAVLVAFVGSAQSQLSISVHIGSPPVWGPDGYNNDVRYYYLPDIEAYYDIRTSMFIYLSGNQWVHRRNLPARYRNYDLYHGYKVVMNDYRGNAPYGHFKEQKMKYARGYRGPAQRNYGERPGQTKNRDQHLTIQQNKTVGHGNNHTNQSVKSKPDRGNIKNDNHNNGNIKNDNHDNGNKGRK